jgi:hypothetical protein
MRQTVTTLGAFRSTDVATIPIASDVLTITSAYTIAQAQSGTADTIATITPNLNGISDTDSYFIMIEADVGDTITLDHGGGNLTLKGAADIVLTGGQRALLFGSAADGFTDFAVSSSGGAVDASDVTYTPTTLADWTGSADPGDVDNALDELAARTTDAEAAIAGHTHDAGDITTGQLAIANGGTGQATQTAAMDALAPTTTKGDLIVHNGTDNIRLPVGTDGDVLVADSGETAGMKWEAPASGTTPQIIINGFTLKWLANDKILVSGGTVAHGTTLINKTVGTVLTMGTGADWIDGASGEAASAFASVYINSSGTLKLHDTLPNASSSNTIAGGNKVADMRVNQPTYDGSNGNGLNATSVVYDSDTGEGSIAAGMLLGVYSDSAFTTGRGKGVLAAASLDDMSFALITAVNTSTNTLTLEAGHWIAINDNDYLIVIENAPVVYRDESGTVWRWIGAMYNNASSNLEENRTHRRAYYVTDEGANYTTTSSSMGAVDSTNFNHDLILTEVGDAICSLAATVEHSAAAGLIYIGFTVDANQLHREDGLIFGRNPDAAGGAREFNLSGNTIPITLLPGTHNFKAQWATSAATATMFAGAATAGNDSHSTFSAYILR